jgi:hypothetical protein
VTLDLRAATSEHGMYIDEMDCALRDLTSGYNLCLNARRSCDGTEYALCDSGCSTHIIGDADMLDNICYKNKVELQGIGKKPIPITGTGSMMLCVESSKPGEFIKIHLDRVFIVKGCPGLLLSTSQLEDSGIITRLGHRDLCELRSCTRLASFARRGTIYVIQMHQNMLQLAELFVPMTCDALRPDSG